MAKSWRFTTFSLWCSVVSRKFLISLFLAPLCINAIAAESFDQVSAKTDDYSLAVQLFGVSHHFDPPRSAHQTWNQQHEGLGLEWSKVSSTDTVTSYSMGLLRDSVRSWGTYSGVTKQKRLYSSATWSADIGGGAFVFYRALDFGGKHLLVPAVLPVASIEHRPSKLGFNVLFVPGFKVGEKEMPSVVFAQLKKDF